MNKKNNRKVIRLQTWDYRWASSYFITICTDKREHYFGEIIDGKMRLSEVGVIATVLWYELQHRLLNLQLGEFVIMPNHINGIFILDDSSQVRTLQATSQQEPNPPINENPSSNHVRTLQATSQQEATSHYSKISPKSNSISTIIRSYKSAVTKYANRLNYPFGWQGRFHDHIIRDQQAFDTISNYIINNPKKWEDDRFHSKKK